MFRSDSDLWDLTTVAELDNPRAIAEAAQRLLDRRDEATGRALRWMERWDAEAEERWLEFSDPTA